MTDENFFEKFGLSVESGKVEIGNTYPIYGMITKIISEELNNVIVELNYNIEATLSINEQEKINLLKERAFEPGIFVSTVTQNEPSIKVDCATIVFGKRQGEMQ